MDEKNNEKVKKSLKTMKTLTVVFAVITVVAGIGLGGLVLERILKGAPGGQVEINPKRLEAIKSFLGAQILSIDEELAKQLGFETSEGILVSEVVEGSPADKGGLTRGDLIIRFDREKVTDVQQLQNLVAGTSPGDLVKMVIKRRGMNKSLYIKMGGISNEQITLASSNSSDASISGKGAQARTPQKTSFPSADRDRNKDRIFQISKPESEDSWGISISPLTPDIEQRYGLADKEGIVVAEVKPNSKGEIAGLGVGDLIMSVNNKKTSDLSAFYSAISKTSNLLLDVYSQGKDQYITMKADPQTPPVAILGIPIADEKERRIAVAANEPSLNSQVAPRFGTASYFLIIDPQRSTLLKSIPNSVIQDDYRGFGIRAAQLVSRENVEAVITGGIGPQAFDALALYNIRIFDAMGFYGNVAEVIQLYNQNRLTELFNPTIPGTGYGRGLPIPASQTSMSQTGGQKTDYALLQGGPPGQVPSTGRSLPSNYTLLQGQPQQGTTNRSQACICPQCGYIAPHQIGVPCYAMTCPRCGSIMVRADRLINLTGGKPEQIPPVGRPENINYSLFEYAGDKTETSFIGQTSVSRTGGQKTDYVFVHNDSDDEEKQKGKDKDKESEEGYKGKPSQIPPMGKREETKEANVINIWVFGDQPVSQSQGQLPGQIPPLPQEQYRYPQDQPRYSAQVPSSPQQGPQYSQAQSRSPVGDFGSRMPMVAKTASPQSLFPGLALPDDKGSAAHSSPPVNRANFQTQDLSGIVRVGTCYCPYCGIIVTRPAGTPCSMMTCPNCGGRLINTEAGNTASGNNPASRNTIPPLQVYTQQQYTIPQMTPQSAPYPDVSYGTGAVSPQSNLIFGSPRPIGPLGSNIGQQSPLQIDPVSPSSSRLPEQIAGSVPSSSRVAEQIAGPVPYATYGVDSVSPSPRVAEQGARSVPYGTYGVDKTDPLRSPGPYTIASDESKQDRGREISTIRPEAKSPTVPVSLQQPKVAIAVDGKKITSDIAPFFDNARYFLILGYGTYEAIDNPNAKDKIGSGAQTAQFLVSEGVGVVIVNNISLEALQTLGELKVKVYSGVSGKADQVIEWYQSGSLPETSLSDSREEGKHDSSSGSKGKGPREDKQRSEATSKTNL